MNRLESTAIGVALMCLVGCSLPVSGDAGPDADAESVTISFTRVSPAGYVDMSLDFVNSSAQPIAVTGRLVARDDDGAV